MRKLVTLALLVMLAISAAADSKEKGTTSLKDVQPAGTTDKKQKHQQYDLFFQTPSGKEYTCRTQNAKIKATDLVVGSTVGYEVKENKGKVKTDKGKSVDCMVVRVANVSGPK